MAASRAPTSGLHPIVQDLAWHPAHGSEGRHMAAQDGLQILVRDKACPDQPAVAKHQREQPDFANHAGLVGEDHLELRKINLSLLAWWGLEAHFERRCKPRPHLAQKVGHRGVAAVIALLADLAQQSAAGQARIGDDPLAQISLERFKPPWPRLAWTIGRWLQAALDVFAHCLAIDADPARDRRDAQPLLMKIQDHDKLPKLDHRLPSRPSGRIIERRVIRLPGARPGKAGSHLGNFQTANLGSFTPAMTAVTRNKKERLTALLHHVDTDCLRWAFF